MHRDSAMEDGRRFPRSTCSIASRQKRVCTLLFRVSAGIHDTNRRIESRPLDVQSNKRKAKASSPPIILNRLKTKQEKGRGVVAQRVVATDGHGSTALARAAARSRSDVTVPSPRHKALFLDASKGAGILRSPQTAREMVRDNGTRCKVRILVQSTT